MGDPYCSNNLETDIIEKTVIYWNHGQNNIFFKQFVGVCILGAVNTFSTFPGGSKSAADGLAADRFACISQWFERRKVKKAMTSY